jgi:hypothetical protein
VEVILMARVVAVHGINNQYLGESTLHAAWFPALRDGMARAEVDIDGADVRCAFYGDLFRGPERVLGADATSYSAADLADVSERALLGMWWSRAAEIDGGVVPPGENTLGAGMGAVQTALAALAGSRFFAGLAEHVLIRWIKQVHRYFTEPDLRMAIRQRVAASIDADTRVIVAHSLGSVAAYEALCAMPDWPVRTLVTVGSPLGIRNVIFERLLPTPAVGSGPARGAWPGQVRDWTNIADRNDVVALVKDLRPCFGLRVRCLEVDTGMRAHEVTRYLTARSCGRAIAEGLAGV